MVSYLLGKTECVECKMDETSLEITIGSQDITKHNNFKY